MFQFLRRYRVYESRFKSVSIQYPVALLVLSAWVSTSSHSEDKLGVDDDDIESVAMYLKPESKEMLTKFLISR